MQQKSTKSRIILNWRQQIMRKGIKYINPNKPVLLDMDGIICDLYTKWFERYNELSGESLTLSKMHFYNLADLVQKPEIFFPILDEKDFFTTLEPLPNAIKYIKKLTELNLSIVIVTYVPWNYPNAYAGKQQWIEKHMPWFKQNNIIFAYRKHSINGTLLFDDKPDNLRYWKQENPNGITCSIKYAYNRNMKDAVDIFLDKKDAWENFYKIVKKGYVNA